MAEYGRDWSRRPRRSRRPFAQRPSRFGEQRFDDRYRYGSRSDLYQRPGPQYLRSSGYEPGLEEGFGYGLDSEYDLEMQQFSPGRGRTQRGYPSRPGYQTERGYRGGEYEGWSEYGSGADYLYDFEFGGRGYYSSRPGRGQGSRSGELRRLGATRFREAREGAPLPREGSLYGREFARHEPIRQRQSQRSPFRGAARGGEEFRRSPADEGKLIGPLEPEGGHPRYGHTPSDRWPDSGHELSHLDQDEIGLDDGEVREAVLENLFQDSWIDPERIDVDVDGGVVTLTGEVRDFMEARYAWDDAWESIGVRGVINNLTVRADLPSERMEMPQTSGAHEGGGRTRGR